MRLPKHCNSIIGGEARWLGGPSQAIIKFIEKRITKDESTDELWFKGSDGRMRHLASTADYAELNALIDARR